MDSAMGTTANERMYSSDFYSSRESATARAANAVLGIVLGAVSVRSVCDVGCGTGTWIEVARQMGVNDVLGFEGAWVKDQFLVTSSENVRRQDLDQPINDDRRFDLAICLEVAEHLTPARGPGIVADLCQLADVVLFSAAIPGQGGTGHVNEQWQSYWASLFDNNGHRAFDLVRPLLWSNNDIPFWYRQNTLVYVARNTEQCDHLQACAASPPMLDLVHPKLYREKEHPPVKQAAMRFARAVYSRFRQ